MSNRSNYWSCSKFANWLRGTMKPKAATGKGWNTWEQEAKSAHPVRYWLAEEGLDMIQNFIWWPIDKIYNVKYYINNRWVTRTHSLTAHPRDIKPGTWCDVGNRFLPCLFNELVDYVEVELAWWHLAWSPEERSKYNMPWWAVGWWRVRAWRCPQAGLDNLEWQRQLRWSENEVGKDSNQVGKLTPQAEKAEEILALYKWWTEVYPNRPDPHDASGWTAYCARQRDTGKGFLASLEDRNEEEQKESSNILDRCHDIEAAQEKEDEEMMIRLIRIRNSLWT